MHTRVLADAFGRRVKTLRVSLTEHCNFRCVYCMPPEGLPVVDTSRYLTAREIARFVAIIADMGVDRVRLTGGEPLLRKDIVDIVTSLRTIAPIRKILMTTNGSLLSTLARPLKNAGLDGVNVSLDSLDATRFAEVTRVAQYRRVRAGIDAAMDAGLTLKLNVVVLRGMPSAEILEFVHTAVEREIVVRFLEFMPLCGSGWRPDLVFPIGRVRDIVAEAYDLRELPRGDRPAQTFAIGDGPGRVGFIAPLSEPFCDRCSRIRLSADGTIRPCLFSNYEYALGVLLKNGAGDDDIAAGIEHAVLNKPWGSEFSDAPFAADEKVSRSAIGTPLIRHIGG